MVDSVEDQVTLSLCSAFCRAAQQVFAEDPWTEIGKVQRCPDAPGTWMFFVYVMSSTGSGGRRIERCNAVCVSPLAVEVVGPDEKTIAQALKVAA